MPMMRFLAITARQRPMRRKLIVGTGLSEPLQAEGSSPRRVSRTPPSTSTLYQGYRRDRAIPEAICVLGCVRRRRTVG